MSCLNPALLKKLASKVTLQKLVNLKDSKDRLTSKLYARKLVQLTDADECIDGEEDEDEWESDASDLSLCINCNDLFTSEQEEWEVCPKAKV